MAVEVCGVFIEMRYEQTLTNPKRWNPKIGFCENVLEQQLNFYVPSIFHTEHLGFEDCS